MTGAGGVTLLLCVILNSRYEMAPPLGPFLDPFHGFWRNAESNEVLASGVHHLPNLNEAVSVKYDDRNVPHVFAGSDYDLYYAQGYVTAQHRLWQMEFMSFVAGGRLSEIFGSLSLNHDRYQRRIGMHHAAQSTLEALREDKKTTAIIDAYVAGVNSYINSLKYKDFPIEYKLLGYAPESWTPLKTVLISKFMSQSFVDLTSELQFSRVLANYDESIVNRLFSIVPEDNLPLIPKDTEWDMLPVPLKEPSVSTPFLPDLSNIPPRSASSPTEGSNSWVISGDKTTNRYPILANDPHLMLTLPSIWYEIQLIGPSINAYGVSIPGTPGIVIGFNQDVAWGLTNARADVADWYAITFKDDGFDEYHYEGSWRKTRKIVETIKVRGGQSLIDTVFYTHHGPIVLKDNEPDFNVPVPRQMALRWTAHEPSNEFLALYLLNRARSCIDISTALPFWRSPPMNFVFADRSNNIGARYQGLIPARWNNQGRYISDGSRQMYEWQSWIPQDHLPQIINPTQEFIYSANQYPVDTTYPYFLNGRYALPDRARRIRDWFTSNEGAHYDQHRKIQMDTYNQHAASVLASLLSIIDPQQLSTETAVVLNYLESWNFYNDADEIAPTVFHEWWRRLSLSVWADEFGDVPWHHPSRRLLAQMINDEPDSKWFNNTKTPMNETLIMLVTSSFLETVEHLRKQYGPIGQRWKWGNHFTGQLAHPLFIPGFGKAISNIGGGEGMVNRRFGRTGPSWRMVVELGPKVRAWGVYPGGQAGNPGSPNYDAFVETWAKGELYELIHLENATTYHPRIRSTLILERENE